MKIKKWVVLFISSVVLSVLAGCTLLHPVSEPPIHKYTLNASNVSRVSIKPTHSTLLISRPKASAEYDTQQMMYVTRRHELRHFSLNEWAIPPAQMLGPLLMESLQRTGGFKAVVTTPFAGATHFRLDVNMIKLQQNFLTDPSRIDFVTAVNLVDVPNERLIASRRFVIHEAAPQNNPYGGVLAANRAVGRWLVQVNRFVRRALG